MLPCALPNAVPRLRRLLWLIWVVCVCAIAGCGPVGGSGEGPGGRQQSLALTPEQEYRLGVEAYQEILRKSQVVPDGPNVERLRRVGQRIADVALGSSRMSQLLRREINIHADPRYFQWEFNVLRSDQINAFCLPGGKVAAFTGLFHVTGDEDALLAVVLGHEIAHALAHHASERIYRPGMSERALQALTGGEGNMGGRE